MILMTTFDKQLTLYNILFVYIIFIVMATTRNTTIYRIEKKTWSRIWRLCFDTIQSVNEYI